MESENQSTAPAATKTSRQGISRGNVIAIAAVVALASFVLGTRASSLPYIQNYFQAPASAGPLDLSEVQQTYDLLQSKYAGGELSKEELIEGAKKGLVAAAGDPYTVYFTSKEADEFLGDLEGTFTGIGAELSKRDDRLTIVATIDGSPAKASGLLAGDNIVKVNDEETTGWSVDQAVAKIRGEKGTTVKLTVIRNSSDVKEFTITRDTINNPSVTSEIKDNVGYMRISRFAQNDTATLARQYAEEYKQKKVKGVVLDLRGNGGGYVTAAQDIASLWLGSGKVIVSERNGDKVIDEIKSNGNPVLEGVPTVVLIDGGSASASEIVAGALRDYDAATLLGEKSFGKGSVQDLPDAPGGGKLKVTIAKWYTPKGKNIDKEGIKPDTEIKLTPEDVNAGRDPQKDKAFEQLR